MKKVLGMFALAAVIALPSMSYAATYAYVNSSGEVAAVTADTAAQALATAPNMDIHSGVMLLSNPNDGIIGDTVVR
ncbi:MAG: hypothetical protein JWN90_368 [Parcubacteria group bacterium]|nr:hypothetical protein [Parcubacteria group bacterium]